MFKDELFAGHSQIWLNSSARFYIYSRSFDNIGPIAYFTYKAVIRQLTMRPLIL